MDYFNLKTLHVGLAMLSLGGFIVRWMWMKSGSALLQHWLTRTLPHLVDTLFLATGIWLTFIIHQYPLGNAWLTAKLVGLVAYIVLGTLALKSTATSRGRTLAFAAALFTFGWIVSVAWLKTAWGFLSFLN